MPSYNYALLDGFKGSITNNKNHTVIVKLVSEVYMFWCTAVILSFFMKRTTLPELKLGMYLQCTNLCFDSVVENIVIFTFMQEWAHYVKYTHILPPFCPQPLGSGTSTDRQECIWPYSINIRNTENAVYSHNTLLGFDTDQGSQGTASEVFLTFTTHINSLSKHLKSTIVEELTRWGYCHMNTPSLQ